MKTYRLLIARAAILAQLVFVGGWLVIGVLEDHGFRPMRHDISDRAALTAHDRDRDRGPDPAGRRHRGPGRGRRPGLAGSAT